MKTFKALVLLFTLFGSMNAMSVSIYAASKFDESLTEAEVGKVEEILAAFSKDDEIEKYVQTGIGFSGESFDFWTPAKVGAVEISGSAQLPTDESQVIEAIGHWLALFTEIRNTLNRGSWHVHIDDWDVEWDPETNSYHM